MRNEAKSGTVLHPMAYTSSESPEETVSSSRLSVTFVDSSEEDDGSNLYLEL